MHQTCVLDLREGEVIIENSINTAVNEYRFYRECQNKKGHMMALGFLECIELRYWFSPFSVILTPMLYRYKNADN